MKNKFAILVIIVTFIITGIYFIGQSNSSVLSESSSSETGTTVGDLAPDFTYTTIDDKKVENFSLSGKVIVITSFTAWCPTCLTEAREFAPVYQKYQNKSVKFITVDIDRNNSKDFIQQVKQDVNTPWDYADALGGSEVIQKFRLDRFEVTYVIDRQGVIRFKDNVITNTEMLDQELQKLL